MLARKLAAPLILAAIGVVLALLPAPREGRPSAGPTTMTRCPAGVVALLGTATVGTTLAGFQLDTVHCERLRTADLELSRGAARLTVTVAAPDALPYPPPVKTARTSLFYHLDSGTPVSNEELLALVNEVAARVRAAESLPNPPGW